MRVTLISDASYCHTYKVAGYGFWVASERGSHGGSGAITRDVGNNLEAEMMSICNGIWQGLRHGSICKGDSLLLQNDCLSAMNKLMRVQDTATPGETEVLRYFEKLVREYSFRVEFRHVKGHTQNSGSRFVANRMCDKRALKAMRSARIHKIKAEMKDVFGE